MTHDKDPSSEPLADGTRADLTFALESQNTGASVREEQRSPEVDEVHRRIGRNFLRYQAIETTLKFILPYIHPEGSRNGAAAFRRFHETRVKGKTLGALLPLLKEAVDASPEFALIERLDSLRKARNDLAHGFYGLHDIDLLSPGAVPRALDYLEREWHQSDDLYLLLLEVAVAGLQMLTKVHPELAAEYAPRLDRLRQGS